MNNLTISFSIPTNIHFGQGKINDLVKIAKAYGTNCLLVTTDSKDDSPLDKLYEKIKEQLNDSDFNVTHYREVAPDPTTEIVEKGIQILQDNNIDFVLAVGGGSSIDTAKTICLLNDLKEIDWSSIFNNYTNPHENYKPISSKYIPLISVATTAGTGSEVTQAAVISRGEEKNSIFHPLNYSDHAILDPDLLLSLPKKLTASTGFDAFCHAFESYINPSASVFSELASLEAIRAIKDYLLKSTKDLTNVKYRSKLLYAQTLAGVGLSNAGAAAPHPLAEIIGGIGNISHGESLALVFPEFLANNYKNNIDKFANVARLFDQELEKIEDIEAASQLGNLIKQFLIDLDLYYSFDDYNIKENQFDNIINCPVLGFLPFGSKEDLQKIILDSKNNR